MSGFNPVTLDPDAPPPSVYPIAQFKRAASSELLDLLNILVRNVNQAIGSLIVGQGAPFVGAYSVGTLPTPSGFTFGYATDGLKIGELTGHGTGVPVYYSNGAWRNISDDAPVNS